MATERRLIDANAFFDTVRFADADLCEEDANDSLAFGFTREAIKYILGEQPTVDAVEVVHGRWEDEYRGAFANPRFRCSICKEKALYRIGRDFLGTWNNVQALTPRCPFCGAKMDGERKVEGV